MSIKPKPWLKHTEMPFDDTFMCVINLLNFTSVFNLMLLRKWPKYLESVFLLQAVIVAAIV